MTADDTALLEPELEDRLRRGLALLAEETPAPRGRRAWLPAAAAAAVVLLAGAGVAIGLGLTASDGPTPRHQAGPSAPPPVASTPPTTGGPTVIGQGISYDLPRLVRESPRIVIGTVAQVTHGDASDSSGGLPYVLAEVSVDHTLKGPDTKTVVAFDYEYSNAVTADSVQGATFTVGQRVLLFLSSAAGTVHEKLPPPHWQVTGGGQGEYPMHGDDPAAPFTIEQVRQQIGS
jgi:hypothetical protein